VEFTNYFIMFMIGFVAHMVWAYVLHLGYSLILIRDLTDDVLKFVAKASQTTYQIYELKYLLLSDMGKSESQVEQERRVDQMQMRSIQDTIIRNIVTNYPPKYIHLLKFDDWDSAMEYLTEVLKKRRK
jgi:hypothetical protein